MVKTASVKTCVIHPLCRWIADVPETVSRSPDSCLAESAALARSIDLDVVHAATVPLANAKQATFFTSGIVARLGQLIPDLEIGLMVVNCHLSPVQQRNLEKEWGVKVIDRTGLILEIFSCRARTKEGRLQVELASLSYQKSRLVRSWTHLERQKGGFGFMGGPGETQIEADRRLICERISRLGKELQQIKKTRQLHRQARKRIPFPIVALVGYTNSGKSTLFNLLTKAEVLAKDQLFATLDPTMRSLSLPSGHRIILSDTVGFISDIPHELIAAFRATLEEVLEADIIVHVRDIAQPDSEAQKQDVLDVMHGLGVGHDKKMIEVLNKADLLNEEQKITISKRAWRSSHQILLSAITGEGVERFLDELDIFLAFPYREIRFEISLSNGAAIAWLYNYGKVTSRHDDDMKASGMVRLDCRYILQFQQNFNLPLSEDVGKIMLV